MKIKVIVNRRSGVGKKETILRVLREKFNHSLVAVEETRSSQHATEVAQRAAGDNIDTIAVVGGDGTVNAVVNGIAGTDVALGIIPTGTANDLASLYDIPRDPSRACDVILERHIKRADLIDVNGWYYITAGGLGLPCTVAETANAMKHQDEIGKGAQHVFGSRLYLFATLYEVVRKAPPPGLIKIRWNDGSAISHPLAFIVANQPRIGGHFLIAPRALNHDGMFDICLIENPPSRAQTLLTVLKMFSGAHVDLPYVKAWRASELILESEAPTTFFGDGEVIGRASEFRIKILPRAINVVTPKSKTLEE